MPAPGERAAAVDIARHNARAGATPAREALNKATTEAEFQEVVMGFARLHDWRVFHVNDSRRQVGGHLVGDIDAKGFPDLLMLRGERIVVAELKSTTGRLTPEQEDWLGRFSLTAAETYVWSPASDWSKIEDVLR